MSNLKEDLIKMDRLQGEELDAHLLRMKERYTSHEEQEIIKQHILGEADEIRKDMKEMEKCLTIREQIKDVIHLVPLSYIAKTYFGKSRAWLYQRINGYKVKGKVYTLNEKEIEVFNQALKDIGEKIGSLSVG